MPTRPAETRNAASATLQPLKLSRVLQARRDTVFRAWTAAEHVERWFSPETFTTHDTRVRPEIGSVSTFDAVYQDVIPNERLVYSYQMFIGDQKISVSLATIQLKSEGARTTLKITEQGAFLDGYDDAGSREHGTGLLLDALGASLRN